MQKHNQMFETLYFGRVLPVQKMRSTTLLNETDEGTYSVSVRKLFQNASHARHDHRTVAKPCLKHSVREKSSRVFIG